MRPPLNAGENDQLRDLARVFAAASMRPPLNAGENADDLMHGDDRASASMRPPLNAGENEAQAARPLRFGRGFNEAPAERGGKHPAGVRTFVA